MSWKLPIYIYIYTCIPFIYVFWCTRRKLQKAEEQIELLSDGLDNVEKNVSDLREQLNVNTKEAAEIELNINKEKKTIEAAQRLVEKLDDEFSRWGVQVFFNFFFYIKYIYIYR